MVALRHLLVFCVFFLAMVMGIRSDKEGRDTSCTALLFEYVFTEASSSRSLTYSNNFNFSDIHNSWELCEGDMQGKKEANSIE